MHCLGKVLKITARPISRGGVARGGACGPVHGPGSKHRNYAATTPSHPPSSRRLFSRQRPCRLSCCRSHLPPRHTPSTARRQALQRGGLRIPEANAPTRGKLLAHEVCVAAQAGIVYGFGAFNREREAKRSRALISPLLHERSPVRKRRCASCASSIPCATRCSKHALCFGMRRVTRRRFSRFKFSLPIV